MTKSQRYSAKHYRVAAARGRPPLCEFCGTKDSPKYEWATRHEAGGMSPEDYVRLCRSCHKRYDAISYFKLSLDQLSEIRSRYNGHNARALSVEFGVQRSTIARWVGDLKVKPTEEVLSIILEARARNDSWRSISRRLGVVHPTAQRWAREYLSDEEIAEVFG